jgi:hypothetical protein
MDKFWRWLAMRLPKKLVFWAAVRVMAEGIRSNGTINVQSADVADKLMDWRNYAYEPKVWGHWQNLTDSLGKTKRRSGFWHGRAWLHLWSKQIGLEWLFFRRTISFGLTVRIGGQDYDQLVFHLGLPYLCSIYLSFMNFLPRRWFQDWRYWGVWGRETGIDVHNRMLWLSVFHNDDECRFAKGPDIPGLCIHLSDGGFMISFDPADFLLGRQKYSDRTIQTVETMLALPESEYPVKVRLFESSWKRPRWPFVKRILRAEVEEATGKGIPSHAGKGENSWDMDDDYTYSITLQASSVEEALQLAANGILRSREKYGLPTCLQGAQ